MREKRAFVLFFAAFCVLSTVFCAISLSENNAPDISIDIKKDLLQDLPKSAAATNESLDYSDIYQNTTIVRRVFESIKFEVNISEFWVSGGNYTEIQFSFTNNTILNLTMTNATLGNFTYTYNPENNAPIGFQNVTFLIFNGSATSRDLLLNNQSTQVNFTIIANVMVGLSSTQYDRGEFLNADILVNGITDWNVSITDGENGFETDFQDIGNNIYQFSREIDSWFTQADSDYFVRVNVSYNSQWASIYFSFTVLNSPPVIVGTSIVFTPDPVYRTSNCRLELNVTDYENDADPSWINVSFVLEDPAGGKENYGIPNGIQNNHDGSFRQDFVIAATKPAGEYRLNITAIDPHGGTNSYYKYLTVLNNAPKIHDYTINDNPVNASISINYGVDLVFGFNVSDKEGIAYVSVCLLSNENEWFNITRAYYGNMTITIRTFDLVRGKWLVYIYVTDTDGNTIGLDFDYGTAPQEIVIIEDLLSVALPWIALFIGIGVGIAAGLAIGFSTLKRRASKSQETTPSKSLVQTSGNQRLKRVEPKTVSQKKEQPTKRDVEEKVVEKPEPEKGTPQRKIKRKLK